MGRRYDAFEKLKTLTIGLVSIVLLITAFNIVVFIDVKNTPYTYTQGTITSKHDLNEKLKPSKYLEITLDNNYGTVVQSVDSPKYILSKENDIVFVVLNEKRDTPQDQLVDVFSEKKQLDKYIAGGKKRGRNITGPVVIGKQ